MRKIWFLLFFHLCEAPRDPVLVPTASEGRVDTRTHLFCSSFCADDAVSVSLSTNPLTFACVWVVAANSHPCGCTENGQQARSVGADSARAPETEQQLTRQSSTYEANMSEPVN